MADLLMIALKILLVISMAGNLLEMGLRLTIMVSSRCSRRSGSAGP